MIGNNETNFPHEILLTVIIKPLQIIHLLILSFQKLNYQR